jgi:hypothetical protein
MPRPPINLLGQRFGALLVIRPTSKRQNNSAVWACRCDCGSDLDINAAYLKEGWKTSCGCIGQNKERNRNRRTYSCWKHMLYRCTDPTHKSFEDYGGRGITVCARWQVFENFFADMGEMPPGLSLERKNNNRGYCKSNCKWASTKTQNRNKRDTRLVTFRGRAQCCSDWAREYGIKVQTFHTRLYNGWTFKQALLTPVEKR